MWLFDMLRSLFRRWYLLTGFLVLAAGATIYTLQTVSVTYSAKGSLLLMPAASTVGPGGNPYLFLGGMAQALDVVSAKVSAEEVRKPVLDAYPKATFTAEPDRSNSGSVILVSVRGQDREQVLGELKAVMQVASATLTELQDAQSVPAPSRITIETLVVDKQPGIDAKGRTTAVLATAGGGVAAALLLTGFVDGRLLARTTGNSADGGSDTGQTSSDMGGRRLKSRILSRIGGVQGGNNSGPGQRQSTEVGG
ncbi:hypothetical protein J2T23_003671 [Pseudarthrobacter niigatensis]|uniref:Capsular polysaccharide biosynthesis protein n=1 Tax=Pseudarthrobacter niigatensis TaxID=369935 RepID=A0AAJ1SVC8_9MICC|nr:hypothetical protein [Pseudarthrobacter niigatensis]MDQ0267623.1 hypothetical protein [Pseudarthrobacter niigatensis]